MSAGRTASVSNRDAVVNAILDGTPTGWGGLTRITPIDSCGLMMGVAHRVTAAVGGMASRTRRYHKCPGHAAAARRNRMRTGRGDLSRTCARCAYRKVEMRDTALPSSKLATHRVGPHRTPQDAFAITNIGSHSRQREALNGLTVQVGVGGSPEAMAMRRRGRSGSADRRLLG